MGKPKFIKSGLQDLEFSKANIFPDIRPIKPNQRIGYSDDRTIKVAELGREEQFFELSFRRLTENDYQNLLNWFQSDTIRWARETFIFQDTEGRQYTVRYIDSTFRMPRISAGLYDVDLLLRQEMGSIVTQAPAPPPPPQTYADLILADNPVAYWRLGESSGSTTAKDETNNHNGTYQGNPPLGAPGAIANDTDTALGTLTGDYSQYVEIPNHPDLTFTTPQALSIEAWVYPTDLYHMGNIVGKPYASSFQDPYFEWCLFFWGSSGGQINFRTNTTYNNSQATLALNQYSHVVVTWSKSSGKAKFYINGQLDSEPSHNSTIADTNGQNIRIGANVGLEGFKGRIDEVALYDFELTAQQVLDHYNKGIGQ